MQYNPKSRQPFALSVDEIAEIINALTKVNANGTGLNRVVSITLGDRLRNELARAAVNAGPNCRV